MSTFLLLTSVFLITLKAANTFFHLGPILFCIVIKSSPSKSPFGGGEEEWAALLAVSKARPCSVLNAAGDYPACEWDALCTTQQRAFHGQSADPLAGVQLRQCNPKLFNQITRAWEKFCLWVMHGGVRVERYESQCVIIFRQRCCWALQALQMLLAKQVKDREVDQIMCCRSFRCNSLSKRNGGYWKWNDKKYVLVLDIPVSEKQITLNSEIKRPKMLFGVKMCSVQLICETSQAVWHF